MEDDKQLKTPIIILVKPQMGENIGAAARAMGNFAHSELRIVAPRDGWPNPYANASSSGADYIVDNAKIYKTTKEAISDINYLAATTARLRDIIKPISTPAKACHNWQKIILNGNKMAILFGCEKSGLENDEIALADEIINFDVNKNFSSLNLAQSVLLCCYEYYKLALSKQYEELDNSAIYNSQELAEQSTMQKEYHPNLFNSCENTPNIGKTRFANREELIHMFEHLENELYVKGFLKPEEKKPKMIRNIRSFFLRAKPTESEVKTMRGIIRTLTKFRKIK